MKTSSLLLLLTLMACGPQSSPTHKQTQLSGTGPVSVIMSGVGDVENFKQEALKHGVRVEGDKLLFLTGAAEDINGLKIPAESDFSYQLDESMKISSPPAFSSDNHGLYQAKKDLGILDFWKKNPLADGRGVVVGLIDDGISPHQQGFLTTTTGARKLIAKGSQSTFTTFDLKESDDGYSADIDEKRTSFSESLDLNGDGTDESWKIKVSKDLTKACIGEDCKGNFSATGDYFLSQDGRFSFMVEIDASNKKIKILQPEMGEESHGEGVASVLAGYRIGNLTGFDGISPGSQIVDYDLSEVTDVPTEHDYTISTFLKGMDWLGCHGAEVVNISYSMYFSSVETQNFMSKAIDTLIKKHNMVVAFSAGNNGPGLGSLNRRSMYPDSALVVGAYISKELDERIAGVTGVPEEGRIAFYSSRGPGQGIGPTLIAPLTSLTNGTPDTGHQAFNGTSSATPALAGAAAVLISAIKQAGLKVDAPSVVHALRLSGRRLKAEPFIFQGNGLPQVEVALEIYKKIINGEVFKNVRGDIYKGTLDGQSLRGIFLRTSTDNAIETRSIFLTGSLSAIAPAAAKINLLVPVRIEYSAGITGPRELWVSTSESRLNIDINMAEALSEGALEAFGEVKIISQLDQSVLTSIPVTIVNDQSVKLNPEITFKLTSEEGQRLHIYVPEGVKAFKVITEVLEGEEKLLRLSVFDTQQIRIIDQRISSDLWIEVQEAGHHQIGISLDGGTARGATVKIKVETIDVKLQTYSVVAGSPTLNLQNGSKNSFQGILTATKVEEVIKAQVITSAFKDNLEITQTLEKGHYAIRFSAVERHDLSYNSPVCTGTMTDASGVKTLFSSKNFKLHEKKEVTFRCLPFDYGITWDKSYSWVMKLVRISEEKEARVDLAPKARGYAFLFNLEAGKYLLKLKDGISDQSFELGELDVY